MFSGGTAGCSVQALSTGGLFQFDGTTANTNTGALPVGTWGRLLTRFNAATTDFNQWGSAAAVTGTSAGNTDPASQYSFFSSVGGGSKLNLRMHLHLVFPYIPSGGQLASLDASAISYFGITI
jgi:hypothetical protein